MTGDLILRDAFTKDVGFPDPFGDRATAIRGLLDELGIDRAGGDGPGRERLATLIRDRLVYDGPLGAS